MQCLYSVDEQRLPRTSRSYLRKHRHCKNFSERNLSLCSIAHLLSDTWSLTECPLSSYRGPVPLRCTSLFHYLIKVRERSICRQFHMPARDVKGPVHIRSLAFGQRGHGVWRGLSVQDSSCLPLLFSQACACLVFFLIFIRIFEGNVHHFIFPQAQKNIGGWRP